MNYAERRELWDRCWGGVSSLPEYFSDGELQQLIALRTELFDKYLGNIHEVSEFGCGLGHNLVSLLGTGRRLRAFDWSVEAVRRCAGLGLESYWFDMLTPTDIKVSGAVLTVHALEQLGADWQPFLSYLVSNHPQICIHIEPIEELYDESNQHDAACLAYHRKRGYLVGFLTKLREMARAGEAELIEVRKSPFGGMNHDAYSVVVWRPL